MERNIAAMAQRALRAGVRLRPHFKTHKSLAIAEIQRAGGAEGFTVSKLDEAEVLLEAGFDDVLVTTQLVSQLKLDRAASLARSGRLVVAVDSIAGVEAISAAGASAGLEFEVSIEVDSGLRRAGVTSEHVGELAAEISRSGNVRLHGAFTHAGHAYAASGSAELRAVATEEVATMHRAAGSAASAGVTLSTLSIGSTPTVLSIDSFSGIHEIRPGNYLFLDRMQVALGVASDEDCALSVAATVMSRPAKERAVVDAGSKSLGLDKGAHGVGTITDYGQLIGAAGHISRLSEEHGVLDIPPDSPLQVGDKVRILPNHACSVANLHREYHGLRDEEVERRIPIDAAGAIH